MAEIKVKDKLDGKKVYEEPTISPGDELKSGSRGDPTKPNDPDESKKRKEGKPDSQVKERSQSNELDEQKTRRDV